MKLLSLARTAAFLMSNDNNNYNTDSSALSVTGRSLLQRFTHIAAGQRRGLQDEDEDGGAEEGLQDDYEDGDEEEGLQDEDEDGDEEAENSIFFHEELNNAVDAALEFCDIDLDSLSFFDGEDIDLDLQLFQYYAQLFAGVCNDDDETTFRTALDTFQACSSFDLVGAMENLDDALVGAAFECAMVSAPSIKDMKNASELADFELPYECSEAFLGRNPLGNMIRNTVLYPDKILPCFSALSADIPRCTLEAWPIPVVGPILKRIGCFVGRGKYFLEIVSEENLNAFDECLPELDENIKVDDCDNILLECEYIDETEFLLPVPFSDLTVRVAKESGLTDVVTRYDNFFDKCEYERWKGWTYTSTDFNLEEMYGSQTLAASSTTSSTTSSTKDSGGKFGWGFFTGLLVASFVWSAVIAFHAYKKRGSMLRDFETGKPNYSDTGRPSVNLNAVVRDTTEDFSHTEDSTDHDDFNTVHLT